MTAVGDVVRVSHGRRRFVAVVDRPRPDLPPSGRWWDVLYRDRGQVSRLAVGDGAMEHISTPSFVPEQELRHGRNIVTVIEDRGATVWCMQSSARVETRGGERLTFAAAPADLDKPRLVLDNFAQFFPQLIEQ
jgi:hypothetical protein